MSSHSQIETQKKLSRCVRIVYDESCNCSVFPNTLSQLLNQVIRVYVMKPIALLCPPSVYQVQNISQSEIGKSRDRSLFLFYQPQLRF